MRISEAVKNLLAQTISPHLDHYHAGLELHIDPMDEATPQLSKTFKYRIPKNGSTDPIDNDQRMPYACDLVQQVGTSGWNWREKRSEFVIFDFDSQDGHKEGLTEGELQDLQVAATKLSYVQVHRSKSGRGLHFYVHFEGHIAASTRREHRLASKAAIIQMSKDAGVEFSEKADCEGGIGWIWNRDAGPGGFELIKRATAKLALPENWREIAVTAERKRRTHKLGQPAASILTDIIAGSDQEALDSQHEELIDWLTTNGWACVLENYHDRYLLRTHTAGLRAAHKALKLRGVFDTISTGSDPAAPNCFCFPQPEGAWSVRRYGQGCQEAEIWKSDGSNWTYCWYNTLPSFSTLSDVGGATPHRNGDFSFRDHDDAAEAIKRVGVELQIPERLQHRQVFFRDDRRGVFLWIKKRDEDREDDGPGWQLHRGQWEKFIAVEFGKEELPSFDHYVRRLTSRADKGVGFVQRNDDGVWIDETKDNCKSRLMALELSKTTAEIVLGKAVGKNWTVINDPFGPEYGPGRLWNREGAQLAFEPAIQNGPTPHWDKVFAHCGKGLDEAVENNEWCKQNGVNTGADYLYLWAALLFQKPKQRLPYLFFYSEDHELGTEVQNAGKSTFHEALGMLMTKGYQKADSALTDDRGFNGEIECAILCVVEETDVGRSGSKAYNRIKEWVTASQLSIHRKGGTPYMSEFNATHWVQCANRRANCPVFDRDSRIVVIEVQQLEEPDPQFKDKLRVEAPTFLRRILSMELPPSAEGRLYLPLLSTAAKREAMATKRGTGAAAFIDGLLKLSSQPCIWDMTPSEIAQAFRNMFPDGKQPSPTALGMIISEYGKEIESQGFVISYRILNGYKHYSIAPKRTFEKVSSGEWSIDWSDDGRISVVIDASDPEAVADDWTDEHEQAFNVEMELNARSLPSSVCEGVAEWFAQTGDITSDASL